MRIGKFQFLGGLMSQTSVLIAAQGFTILKQKFALLLIYCPYKVICSKIID